MVLDYAQLVGQQQAYMQSRLVSDVVAEQEAKAQAQREAVSTQAVSTTTTSTPIFTTSTKPTSELEQIDKQIRKLNKALDSASPKAEEIILERLRQLNESRENLINTGLAYYTIKTEVPGTTTTTPIYSPSLAGGSRSDTVGLFYELEPTKGVPSTEAQPVYAFEGTQFKPTTMTIDTSQFNQPTTIIQTQTLKEQEQQLSNQMVGAFTPQQVNTPRTYSPQETITTQSTDISFAQINPQVEENKIFMQEAIAKANQPYEYLKQKQEEQIYSPFTLSKVPVVAGTTVALFGAGFVKGVVNAPQFFSPTTYQGELQIPIITPTYQFGKYLVTGEYIPELITNPAGTIGEFKGATDILKATPFKQIGEAEFKYGIEKPIKFISEGANEYLLKYKTEIIKGEAPKINFPTPEEFRFLNPSYRQEVQFKGETEPSTFDTIRLVQPVGKEVPSTGQVSLTTGIEIKPETFAEQSKITDIANYPFSGAKNIPVYSETTGELLGYKSIEINPLKTSEKVFEEVGQTGQAKLLEDTIYYKIREGKYVPTETEPARGSVLQQAREEKAFGEKVFDIKLEKASSPKEGEFIDLANTENLAVLGQRTITGEYIPDVKVRELTAPLREPEVFGAKRPIYGLVGGELKVLGYEIPEEKIVMGKPGENLIQPTGQSKLFESEVQLVSLTGKPSPEAVVLKGGTILADVGVGNYEVVGFGTESGANLLSKEYSIRTVEPNPLNVVRDESIARVTKGEEVVDIFPSRVGETQLDLFGEKLGKKEYELSSPLNDFMREVSTMIELKPSEGKSVLEVKPEVQEVTLETTGESETIFTETKISKPEISSSPYANDKGLSSIQVSDATFDADVVTIPKTTREYIKVRIGGEQSIESFAPSSEVIGGRTYNPRLSTTEVFTPLIQESDIGLAKANKVSPNLFLELNRELVLEQSKDKLLDQDNILGLRQQNRYELGLRKAQESKIEQVQSISQIQELVQIQESALAKELRSENVPSVFNPPRTATTPSSTTPTETRIETPREIRLIEERIIPKSKKLRVERERERKKSRFVAITKRRGKVIPVSGSESESVFDALSKGKRSVKETLARSLAVIDVESGRIQSIGTPEGFRPSKRPSPFIVQSNALSSQGEKAEIQSARKSKGVFK